MRLGWLWAGAAIVGAVAVMGACGESTNGSPVSTPPDAGLDGAANGDSSVQADSGRDPLAPPACNDGKIDLGETCDPLSSCPTACPPDKCQLRSLENGGTCNATCANVAIQTQCLNGDGCCPPSCNQTNDDDCAAVCGNGVKEATETCDPKADCPTTCAPNGCTARKLDKAGTCDAKCVADPATVIACSTTADNCCPAAGCAVGVIDPDCGIGGCGNGTKDPTELCDTGITSPAAGSCPTSCPVANKCKVRELVGTGCQTTCVDRPDIVLCSNGDGCCPSGCNATNDSDCEPVCNNGVKEPGEECDGNCPTSCAPEGCQLRKVDKPGTCQAKCVPDTIQTECKASDQCCPANCAADSDNDCDAAITCPNGKVEPNETCDDGAGSPTPCPQSCQPDPPRYSCFAHRGKPITCDVKCNAPILTCDRATDGCCPYVGANGGDCHGGTAATRTDADCQGTGWLFESLATPVILQAGQCATISVSNINVQGSYELTTCYPPGAAASVVPTGNPTIANPTQRPTTGTPISYPVGNDDCDDPAALPVLAGWNCTNQAGNVKMACASPSPGGFLVNYSTPIEVEVCGAEMKATTFPFSVFYNAVKKPTITVAIH